MLSWINGLGWIGTMALALGGGVWGVLTYEDQARLAFRKPLVDKTINLCFEASELAGKLVSDGVDANWQEHKTHFWRLYYGQLVMIEDEKVAAAMIKLGQDLTHADFSSRSQLGSGALDVSGACRDQIRDLMDTEWKMATFSLIKTSDILNSTVKK